MNTATPITSTPPQHHRFHLLDAMRGVAAILVILWHAPYYLLPRGTTSTFLAVDFFFCLSGFVIAFSYERRLQEKFTFGSFAVARTIRLYPMYLLATALGFVVFLWRDLPHEALSGAGLFVLIGTQIAAIPNRFIHSNGLAFPFDPPAWSLFYEFVANLGHAVLVRMGFARSWQLGMVLLISAGWYIRSSVRTGVVDVGWSSDQAVSLGIARVTVSFLAGVLVLRLWRRVRSFAVPRKHHSLLALGLATALVLALISPFSFSHTLAFQLADIVVIFPLIVFLGSFAALPPVCVVVCAFLGDISYPVYVLHVSVLKLLDFSWLVQFGTMHTAGAGLILGTAVVTSIVLSYVLLRVYDEPLRRKLTGSYKQLQSVRTASGAR